jgi:hypothetical protein
MKYFKNRKVKEENFQENSTHPRLLFGKKIEIKNEQERCFSFYNSSTWLSKLPCCSLIGTMSENANSAFF